MLTKQIIFYVQSNITTVGPDILPLIQAMVGELSVLGFTDLEDTMGLINVTMVNFKSQELAL